MLKGISMRYGLTVVDTSGHREYYDFDERPDIDSGSLVISFTGKNGGREALVDIIYANVSSWKLEGLKAE
jgi:hypothetical protein